MLKSVLEAIGTPYAIIRSLECITTRHLLERIISAAQEAIGKGDSPPGLDSVDGRCESISAFAVQLQKLVHGKDTLILALDGIDRQREALPTLLPALARLGEIVRLR